MIEIKRYLIRAWTDFYFWMIMDSDGRERIEILTECMAMMKNRIRSVACRIRGHAERVQGDWPEDSVCPRCGDTEVRYGLTFEVVPPTLDAKETTDGSP